MPYIRARLVPTLGFFWPKILVKNFNGLVKVQRFGGSNLILRWLSKGQKRGPILLLQNWANTFFEDKKIFSSIFETQVLVCQSSSCGTEPTSLNQLTIAGVYKIRAIVNFGVKIKPLKVIIVATQRISARCFFAANSAHQYNKRNMISRALKVLKADRDFRIAV